MCFLDRRGGGEKKEKRAVTSRDKARREESWGKLEREREKKGDFL